MEEIIERLFNIISERSLKWMEYKELFGEDDDITQHIFNSICGLDEAFEIISGHSYTTHLIARIEENMKAS